MNRSGSVQRSVSAIVACWCWSVAIAVVAETPFGPGDFAGIYRLPVMIDTVVSVCPWKSASGSGYVRVIRTRGPTGHGLYLQWIRFGVAGSEAEVISTRSIEELATEFDVAVEMPVAQLEKDHCLLQSQAEDSVNGRRYRLDIRVGAPGDYQFAVTRHLSGGLP
ncbi:hypothetical protein [Candidatus Thalassolituus haligoni]|uniref:hypothetical protein n=1 Tax=Candidatus Thalassolituus haligoni TaxID=3100113 RepID=UPI0035145B13